MRSPLPLLALALALAGCAHPEPRSTNEQVAAYRAQGLSQEEAMTQSLQDSAAQTHAARDQSDRAKADPYRQTANRPETAVRQYPAYLRPN